MTTKMCSAGQHEVSVRNFWKRKGNLQPNCIDCQKAINKARYHVNKDDHIKRVRANMIARQKILKIWKQSLKCVRCDENYWKCLDFHHLDPSKKDFSVGDALQNYGWEKLLNELEKCVVLCKCCHVKVHDELLKVDESDIVNSVDIRVMIKLNMYGCDQCGKLRTPEDFILHLDQCNHEEEELKEWRKTFKIEYSKT